MSFQTIDFSFPEKILTCEFAEDIRLTTPSTRYIYQLYESILQRAKELKATEFDRYLKGLGYIEQLKLRVTRLQAPAVVLNFEPLIHCLERHQTFNVCLENLELNDKQKLHTTCVKLEKLTTEAIGFSFSASTLKNIFQLPQTKTLVAKETTTDKIIGYISGTELCFSQLRPLKTVKVFFIASAVKDPAYPGINFLQLVQAKEADLIQSRDPDYIAVNVLQSKCGLIKRYKSLGFEVVEEYTSTSQMKSLYMVKKLKADALSPPAKFEEIPKAINKLTQKEWGLIKFTSLGFYHRIKIFSDRIVRPFFDNYL